MSMFSGASQGSVGVDATEVDKVASQMQDAIHTIKRTIDGIDQAAQEVKKGWWGEAADKFGKVADSWNHEVTDLNKSLTELHNAVENGKQTIQNMDAT